jgi:glucokinase
MARSVSGLVGDVGGTNARFALAHVTNGAIRLEEPVSLRAADYATGEAAVRAFLERLAPGDRPRLAVIAAAGPINDGAVSFTNNTAWRFSERELASVCDFAAVRLINDFTAQALAIDHLGAGDVRRIGPEGRPQARATAVILGPGTGFGAAAQVDDGAGRAILTGEGGHIGFAPGDEVEIEIVRYLTIKFGRVSVERLLSGPGLADLHQALAEMSGQTARPIAPDEVTRRALAGDPACAAALGRFCAILGSVAGDFALALGARRGVYIAGGIAPAILGFIESSDFRRRFEAKGRMSDYLKAIPTLVVTATHAALTGAANQLAGLEPRA